MLVGWARLCRLKGVQRDRAAETARSDRPGETDATDATDAEFRNLLRDSGLRNFVGNLQSVADRRSSLKIDTGWQ